MNIYINIEKKHNIIYFDKPVTQFIILGLLIAIYLFLEIAQINLPGLFCDEAIDGVLAIKILRNATGLMF